MAAQFPTFVPHGEQTLVEKDSPTSRTTKSSFFSRSANFGNVSPFLVGTTNTFSRLVHPLLKLPNCVLKFYNLSETPVFWLTPSSRTRHRLRWRTATSTHFWSPTIYTTFHYIHYISHRSNANNRFRITGYSIKIWSQVPTITQAILLRNQSLSVSKLIHKESGVVNRFLTAWQHVWTPWSERTYSMENGQLVFFLSPHTCKTLTPCFCLYQFLYWFWEKNRLFCSLILLIRLQLTLY